ncbi:oligosaccharide flippase family protein [Candidatus Daviesbacteria bacterium]|nr:oligosaccharide flippase family protein [Candidatus Daviesbacteria bacterium]
MDSFKKVSVQTAWQIFGKGVTSLSTIIILGAVSRHFGPSGVGILTLALTYLAFFYLAADFGFNAHLLSKLIGRGVEVEWRKLLGLRIIWSAVLIILALLLLPLLPFQTNRSVFDLAVIFGAVAILGNALFTTSNALFQSKLRYDLSVIASLFNAIPTVILFLLLIYLNSSLPSLMIIHALGWLLTGCLTLFFIRRYLKNLTPVFNLPYVKQTFIEVWPISLTLVFNVVYFRIDSFILTAVKSFAEVGVYNLAYQVFQSALVLPTFIMNGYYPIMLENLNHNKELFLVNIRKALGLMLVISALGLILTWVLSPWVVEIVSGGKGFSGSSDSLRILGLGFPAYFLSAILMWMMVALKRYKILVLIYLVGLIFNAGANLIFIPQYSYIASSWITGASEYLILILQLIILAPVLFKWVLPARSPIRRPRW